MSPSEQDDSSQRPRPKIRIRTGSDQSLNKPSAPATATPAKYETATPAAISVGPEPATAADESAPAVTPVVVIEAEPLPLPANYRLGVLIGLVMVVAGAVLVSRATALAGVLLACLITAALGRVAVGLAALRVPRRSAGVVAVGLAWAVLALLLLGLTPVWQREGELYCAQLTKLTSDLAHLAGVKDSGPAWLGRGLTLVTTTITAAVGAVTDRRVALFFQLALLVGALQALLLLRPAEPGRGVQKMWSGLGELLLKLFKKLGLSASARLAKALALGVVAAIGLSLAGITAPLFVAGWAIGFGFLLRTAPLVTMVLAVPMIAWDLAVIRSAAFVLGTGVALFFVEQKLHWYLYLRPALASGAILPEIHGGEAVRGRGLFGGAAIIVRTVVALVSLGLIGGLLWVVVPAYQQQQAHKQAIAATTALVEGGKTAEATRQLLELEQRYPNDPDVWRDLVKVSLQAQDLTNAVRYAEQYANWQPQPRPAMTTREQLYQKLLGFFPAGPIKFNRAEGYDFILNQGKQPEGPSDFRRSIALKALAANPDSLPALDAITNECLQRNQADEAVTYAEHALKLDPRGLGRHAQVAAAYLIKKDWARVVEECDAELALDPANEAIRTMRRIAAESKEKGVK